MCHIRFLPAHHSFKLSRQQNNETYLDFAVQKEHAFIRNIFDQDELKQSIPISTTEKYHESFSTSNCPFATDELF